jgi:hypothetical protein
MNPASMPETLQDLFGSYSSWKRLILDKIDRIFRIDLLHFQFPDETENIQSPSSNKRTALIKSCRLEFKSH